MEWTQTGRRSWMTKKGDYSAIVVQMGETSRNIAHFRWKLVMRGGVGTIAGGDAYEIDGAKERAMLALRARV